MYTVQCSVTYRYALSNWEITKYNTLYHLFSSVPLCVVCVDVTFQNLHVHAFVHVILGFDEQ